MINRDYVTPLQENIDKTYRVLNYTRIKPRSRPPQKEKVRIFYAPRFFSGQNKKKSAQITRANTVYKHVMLRGHYMHIDFSG